MRRPLRGAGFPFLRQRDFPLLFLALASYDPPGEADDSGARRAQAQGHPARVFQQPQPGQPRVERDANQEDRQPQQDAPRIAEGLQQKLALGRPQDAAGAADLLWQLGAVPQAQPRQRATAGEQQRETQGPDGRQEAAQQGLVPFRSENAPAVEGEHHGEQIAEPAKNRQQDIRDVGAHDAPAVAHLIPGNRLRPARIGRVVGEQGQRHEQGHQRQADHGDFPDAAQQSPAGEPADFIFPVRLRHS